VNERTFALPQRHKKKRVAKKYTCLGTHTHTPCTKRSDSLGLCLLQNGNADKKKENVMNDVNKNDDVKKKTRSQILI